MSGPIDRRSVPAGLAFDRWAAPDGWTLRRFRWQPERAPRGSLLFLGGRGDFAEKYLEALHHWHRRDWRIDGLDWRGQGGSGRLLADPLICHLDSFEPLLDDLEAFLSDWKATTPAPHVAVAHSMGAHLLLRLLAERRGALDGAVLLAPMIGISAGPLPSPALRLLCAAAALAGLGRRRLWRGDIGNVGGRMTSCPHRQTDKIWWKANRPEIASGAPSWGWLRSALVSIDRLKRALGAAPLDLPLLVLVSRDDPVVKVKTLRRRLGPLPRAEFGIQPGTGHELLREADRFRLPVLARIDDFLDRIAAAGRRPRADRTGRSALAG